MPSHPTLPRFSYRATIACVSLEAASAQLGLRWQDVRRAAEEGLLSGVDVGTGEEQAQYRFARVALEEFARDARVLRTDAELAEVMFGLAARQSGLTRRVAFTERLGVSEHTVTRLLALPGERGLSLAPESKAAKGPGGSPLIQWSELVRWVGARRLDAAERHLTPALSPNEAEREKTAAQQRGPTGQDGALGQTRPTFPPQTPDPIR